MIAPQLMPARIRSGGRRRAAFAASRQQSVCPRPARPEDARTGAFAWKREIPGWARFRRAVRRRGPEDPRETGIIGSVGPQNRRVTGRRPDA